MKLAGVQKGRGFVARLKLGVMGTLAGTPAPDVVRVLLYRPEFFGKPFATYVHRLMRGASEWTVGERELIAAFVSKVNGCAFCQGSHQAVANRALGEDVVRAVFADHRTAPITAQMRALLTFLEKLTKDPAGVDAEDVAAVRAAGVSERALESAVHICGVFSTINRIADALGFEVPSVMAFDKMAVMLLKHGYKVV